MAVRMFPFENVGAVLVNELLSGANGTLAGVLLPELREATIWSVAVNGVMAGCRPEYFPILLAVVEG